MDDERGGKIYLELLLLMGLCSALRCFYIRHYIQIKHVLYKSQNNNNNNYNNNGDYNNNNNNNIIKILKKKIIMLPNELVNCFNKSILANTEICKRIPFNSNKLDFNINFTLLKCTNLLKAVFIQLFKQKLT